MVFELGMIISCYDFDLETLKVDLASFGFGIEIIGYKIVIDNGNPCYEYSVKVV